MLFADCHVVPTHVIGIVIVLVEVQDGETSLSLSHRWNWSSFVSSSCKFSAFLNFPRVPSEEQKGGGIVIVRNSARTANNTVTFWSMLYFDTYYLFVFGISLYPFL